MRYGKKVIRGRKAMGANGEAATARQRAANSGAERSGAEPAARTKGHPSKEQVEKVFRNDWQAPGLRANHVQASREKETVIKWSFNVERWAVAMLLELMSDRSRALQENMDLGIMSKLNAKRMGPAEKMEESSIEILLPEASNFYKDNPLMTKERWTIMEATKQ
ncbi:hypothetical protein ACLOJK_039906 [Asimina triloba]